MNQIIKSLKNQDGFAIFIGLGVLFIVIITGVSILFLAHKDKISVVDSGKIRSVALAANTSLKAAETQFLKEPEVVTEILNKYITDKNYQWLLVSDVSEAKKEKKTELGSNGLSYSVRISSYDVDNQIVQLTGTGYGTGNEQKSVTALYQLSGLKKTAVASKAGRYGLYLAGDGRNFDAQLNITGDVYFGNDFHFNSGAKNSRIRGFLKTANDISKQSSIDASGIVIDSGAYIGTGLRLNRSFTVNTVLGVEGDMVLNSNILCSGDGWFNGANSAAGLIDLSSNTIHHSGKIDMGKVVSGKEDNKNATITDMAELVGLGKVNDSAWTVDTTGLYAKAISLFGFVDASVLQTMYNNCSESMKVNDYMIVYDQWGAITLKVSSQPFYGKVIFLLKYGINANAKMFDMAENSRIFILCYDYASLSGFGGQNGNTFNGVILLKDNASMIASWTGSNTILGAIHIASSTSGWQLNGTGQNAELNIIYNNPIIQEFETMGIIHRPSQTGGSETEETTDAIVQTDMKIRAQMVGVVY